MRLILASASPRRAELLTAAGYRFEVQAADIDERALNDELPAHYVRRVSAAKAAYVQSAHPSDEVIVLAADTAVVVDGEILGKPRDPDDAARMLRLLSGRVHTVLTGVCLRSGHATAEVVESTSVEMIRLSEAQTAWYLASGEGTDKAGGYAIQGLASRFIPRIDGSYSNVVGLPVEVVDRLLDQFGPASRTLASIG